jgi:hypothetical protein
MNDDNSEIPPFSEYILSSGDKDIMSLLRKEQVISIVGERTNLLKPAMVLSVPASTGVVTTPLYDWRDVRALASELGVACPYVPTTTEY